MLQKYAKSNYLGIFPRTYDFISFTNITWKIIELAKPQSIKHFWTDRTNLAVPWVQLLHVGTEKTAIFAWHFLDNKRRFFSFRFLIIWRYFLTIVKVFGILFFVLGWFTFSLFSIVCFQLLFYKNLYNLI